MFNPQASSGDTRGFVQDRQADGTWMPFNAASDEGFAEGSSAQYTWMVPFDAAGLFALMGGPGAAVRRLDAVFHTADGRWALTGLGGLHAEMDNEPSTGAPWMYVLAGHPDRAQQTIRTIVETLWHDAPDGIPGNDDLGAMSAWYVWAALGCYPAIPGRSDLLLGSPLFPHARITRSNGIVSSIDAAQAASSPFAAAVRLDGQPVTDWRLPESFVAHGGTVTFDARAEDRKQ